MQGIGLKNISYSSHANKTPFHHRDFALTLVLKVRVFVTVGKEEKVGRITSRRLDFRGIATLNVAIFAYF